MGNKTSKRNRSKRSSKTRRHRLSKGGNGSSCSAPPPHQQMTQQLIQRTIGHLLPNPQVLNFHLPQEQQQQLPEEGLRLMMGAGDLNQGGMPNIELFNTYDVFFCQPWDWNGSLLENVTYLITQPNKLLCFIDAKNPDQIKAFCTLFAGRFSFIDGFGGHCPHFDMSALRRLLQEGGTAANIYEGAETCITLEQMQNYLVHGVLPYPNYDSVTSKIMDLTDKTEPALKVQLCAKIRTLAAAAKRVKIPIDDLETLEIRTLQHRLRMLLFDSFMPLDLVANLVDIKKDWLPHPISELVVTKISPDFKLAEIAAYFAKHGETEDSNKARRIIAAIKADMDNDIIYPAEAKYKTFCRLIESMMKPAEPAS